MIVIFVLFNTLASDRAGPAMRTISEPVAREQARREEALRMRRDPVEPSAEEDAGGAEEERAERPDVIARPRAEPAPPPLAQPEPPVAEEPAPEEGTAENGGATAAAPERHAELRPGSGRLARPPVPDRTLDDPGPDLPDLTEITESPWYNWLLLIGAMGSALQIIIGTTLKTFGVFKWLFARLL